METPSGRRRLRRLAVKQLIARLRDAPCVRCGGRGEDHVFAHLGRPTGFAIADAPRRSAAALAREITFTTRLCGPCHTLACAGRLVGEGLPTMPALDLDTWYAVGAFQGRYSFTAAAMAPADAQWDPGSDQGSGSLPGPAPETVGMTPAVD
jgi:hypothetical protein